MIMLVKINKKKTFGNYIIIRNAGNNKTFLISRTEHLSFEYAWDSL